MTEAEILLGIFLVLFTTFAYARVHMYRSSHKEELATNVHLTNIGTDTHNTNMHLEQIKESLYAIAQKLDRIQIKKEEIPKQEVEMYESGTDRTIPAEEL